MLYAFNQLSNSAKIAAIAEERACWQEDYNSGSSVVNPAECSDDDIIDFMDMMHYRFDAYGSFLCYFSE